MQENYALRTSQFLVAVGIMFWLGASFQLRTGWLSLPITTSRATLVQDVTVQRMEGMHVAVHVNMNSFDLGQARRDWKAKCLKDGAECYLIVVEKDGRRIASMDMDAHWTTEASTEEIADVLALGLGPHVIEPAPKIELPDNSQPEPRGSGVFMADSEPLSLRHAFDVRHILGSRRVYPDGLALNRPDGLSRWPSATHR